MALLEDYVLQECFSINLKWYRYSKNLTQESLAELANTTAKYVSDLERGKFSPSFSKLHDIAKALEVEPYVLLKPDHLDDKINSRRIDGKKK